MYSQHWRSFLPAFHRQRPFGLVKEEGTPRLQSGGVSTSFGYNSSASAAVVSTGSVLRSAKAAIAVQTSVHVVFIAHSRASSTTEKIIADVGTTSGSETLFEARRIWQSK
jgi:hypothetical protein